MGIVRPMYSNPPIYGARLVSEVLKDPELNAPWRKEVKLMADRINEMRHTLVNELKALGSTKDFPRHVADRHVLLHGSQQGAGRCPPRGEPRLHDRRRPHERRWTHVGQRQARRQRHAQRHKVIKTTYMSSQRFYGEGAHATIQR